ncbi:EAL domain-containing protein [Amedibacillus sp. YH-ame10]
MNTITNTKLRDLRNAYAFISDKSEIVIEHANDNFYELVGYSEKELKQKNGARLSALLPVEEFIEIQEFMLSELDYKEFKLSFKKSDNDISFVLCFIQKFQGENGLELFMQCIDINRYQAVGRHLEDITSIFEYLLDYRKSGVLLFGRSGEDIHYCHMDSFVLSGVTKQSKFPNVLLDSGRVHPDYIHELDACVEFMKNAELGKQLLLEIQMLNSKQEYIWIQIDMSMHVFRGHEEVLCVLSDVDAQKTTASQYVEQSLFYQSVLSSKVAYGQFDISNDEILKMGGLWNLYNEVKDTMTYTQLFHSFIEIIVHPDDRKHYIEVLERNNLNDSFDNGITKLGCEFRRIVDQNKMVWMQITIHLFKNPLNDHLMALMYLKNINHLHEEKEVKAKKIDNLTNLYSRGTLIDEISDYLSHMAQDEICAFIYCNINDMRAINQQYGYVSGDTILVSISNILSTVFRKRDVLGRYDNDHFIILLKDTQTSGLEKRIHSLFDMVEQHKDIPYTVSLGIVYARKQDTFVNCFKQANMALMHINNKKENSFFMYSDNLVAEDESQEFYKQAESVVHQIFKIEENIESVNESEFDRLIGEQGDIAYLVHPETYELLVGNQAFYERLGLTKNDCRGRTCYDLLHNRQTSCPFCQKSNWTNDKYFMYRNYNQKLEQEFLIKNKMVTWKGNQALLAFAIDLSNDKSVVDSLRSDMGEETYILAGIQNMQKASTLDGVMESALETIGLYFRADTVRFWDISRHGEESPWVYSSKKQDDELLCYDEEDRKIVANYLDSRQWKDYLMIENSETIMTVSYGMYTILKQKDIQNLQWYCLYDGNQELGMIQIDNLHANLQNVSFLKNFAAFIANEWHKCKMLEDILYTRKYDSLTGLYNRKKYDEFVSQYNPDSVKNLAVIMIDINGLSNINSLKGSKIGDTYLKTVANLMQECFGGAINFRLGGDEFQSIFMDVELKQLEHAIERFQDEVLTLNEFSISIGYAWDAVEKKLATLIEFATQSRLVNKKAKKARINELKNIDHYKMQDELISSLERKEYVIFLQPKVNAKYGEVVGAEALIRKIDAQGNIIPPSEYISKYEQNGIIRYIDLFVFDEVCRLIKKWTDAGKQCPVVSLNFSRLTMMEENLLEIMNMIVKQHDVSKKYIEIEITESYADVGKTMLYQRARQIHEAGFSLSLDDFGTDFTNLSILSDIHVDVLKIDKSLIHSLKLHEKNMTVLKHIIDMCKELHISVIAEGVENMEQRNLLMDLGCYLIQGYLFSRPVDVSTFEKAFLTRVKEKVAS